jgi:hypothetical protein
MSVEWAVSADLGDEAPISARAEIRLRDRAERIRTRKYPRGLDRMVTLQWMESRFQLSSI